ncbi:MAG: divergent polysaccharide deacetylase family protein [Holosporaceae bacterium]|jgi:polysaccharide deacetylase 2 family uncharacterized protein YibQ|nr:divergent polysaccharide deacetylase family protein [Holosporaceae bacterium]
MKKSKKLIVCWTMFFLIVLVFVIVTKFSDNFYKEHSNYQCRILISKDLIDADMDTQEKQFKKQGNSSHEEIEIKKVSSSQQFKKSNNESGHEQPDRGKKLGGNGDEDRQEFKCYEHSRFGDIPKISPDGVRVFDIYSVVFSEKSKKKACLVINLDENIDIRMLSIIFKTLGKSKVTFVVAGYLDNLGDIAKAIVDNGHEFFLQIPTQSSIPEDKKDVVSPFLANTDPSNIIAKLHWLLALTKYAIGIANTTNTLLTKSKNDMAIIIAELSKRGLAFFDFESQNEVVKSVVETSGAINLCAATIVDSKSSTEVKDIYDGKIFVVQPDQLEKFIEALKRHKDYAIAPVSSIVNISKNSDENAKK